VKVMGWGLPRETGREDLRDEVYQEERGFEDLRDEVYHEKWG